MDYTLVDWMDGLSENGLMRIWWRCRNLMKTRDSADDTATRKKESPGLESFATFFVSSSPIPRRRISYYIPSG